MGYTKKRRLTERDKEIYEYIVSYIKEVGYPPTVREIGVGVGLSSTYSVYAHLQHLEIEGWIKTKPYSPRAIKVMDFEFVKRKGA